MKKLFTIIVLLSVFYVNAQEHKPLPQISVNGEGKIQVIPDQATIVISIDTKGNLAKEVKKDNDVKVESVLKWIKKIGVPTEDFRTRRVVLQPNYDWQSKKRSFNANQSIEIVLKDLSKYGELMEGVVDAGANRIDGVTFQSSKMASYQSQARKLAMKDAKSKAEDFVSVLGQKVGKALIISDGSSNYTPQPVYALKTMAVSDGAEMDSRETLAIGEITVQVNVSVSFLLE